jgi:hypothetical protein
MPTAKTWSERRKSLPRAKKELAEFQLVLTTTETALAEREKAYSINS